ncbi:CHD5-like protein-domain-containing protein [Daldinia sp. FL1419]|nr:CHD5-like protein-domain-containing protein [Daldinia sp. FL1419]
MISVLLLVFLVELGVHLVNTVGAATINNLLWNLYLALPTEFSKQAAERKTLQKEYLTIRRDLNATSSQDQFAKWAKLRRQHDKLLEQLEKMKTAHEGAKSRFDSTVNILRWLATSGLKFLLPFWYAKQPMFWLPHGWFPYYAEWILSFPRAPVGSVSIASWQTACAGVVLLVSDTVAAILGLALGAKIAAENQPSLLLFFGPILLPKAISYYRSFREGPRVPGVSIRRLPFPALRAIVALTITALVWLVMASPIFFPENIFLRTNTRLQAPVDVLFNRLSSLRPLSAADEALRTRFVNLESRLLYLQFGPEVLATCPFCSSDDPNTYLYYAVPALLAPHLINLVLTSLATSELVSGSYGPAWRRLVVISSLVGAIWDLYSVGSYNILVNARARTVAELDNFFWTARMSRYLGLVALNLMIACLIYLASTNRAFYTPPNPAVRIEAVIRQLQGAKGRLNAAGIVKNTANRDADLRARSQAYWQQEGSIMREVMEEREVIEGVNDALENRINIADITRDADAYALNVLPRMAEAVAPETMVG